ncbi:MAG: hypothetical protein JWO91_3858 [Acidobacteriaceae bacterium]|nr:hypothetical protein [Acidobacteriaceae bacterium]
MKVGPIVIFLLGAMSGAGAAFLHFRASHSSGKPVVHVENGFEFTARGPYKTVAPLFGAYGERAWAGDHWKPEFLFPVPARDVQGEVFTVAQGHLRSTWVNTALDLEAGHIQYVYVIPDTQAVLIDIHLTQNDPVNTGVKVVYQRTALSAEFNDHVSEQGRKDKESGKEWETAINAALQANKAD